MVRDPPPHVGAPSRFGPEITATGVHFRLWAPLCPDVGLECDGRDHAMTRTATGWHVADIAGARAGSRYRFILPDGRRIADPASRFQPDDIAGASEVIDDRAYVWRVPSWRGRAWEEMIFYEIHVGAFTEAGTYVAATERLADLVDLGVTAIELMPLADFPGRWNWGYDGVLWFAPDATYGRPDELKALVDRAHELGLAVFLDVVWNHFGPVGNVWPDLAPIYGEAANPWGKGLNFDGDDGRPVRDLVLANALHWLIDYRFDGLRLDATHALIDSSAPHILAELADTVAAATPGRATHLVMENSDNDLRWLERRPDGTPRHLVAHWTDDLHHALHTAVTGERAWYYAQYTGRIATVARGLAEGVSWQGEYLIHERRNKGVPATHLPLTAFVAFLQTHDQIGNRPLGDRKHTLLPEPARRALTAILLLAPQIPLLFMGEDWESARPFPYFSDLGADRAETVRDERRDQLKDFLADGVAMLDPMAEATFRAAKLDWHRRAAAPALRHHRDLLALRRREIVPRLAGLAGHSGRWALLGGLAFDVSWRLGDGSELRLRAHLGRFRQYLAAAGLGPIDPAARVLWRQGEIDADTLGPWAVLVTLAAPAAGTWPSPTR